MFENTACFLSFLPQEPYTMQRGGYFCNVFLIEKTFHTTYSLYRLNIEIDRCKNCVKEINPMHIYAKVVLAYTITN